METAIWGELRNSRGHRKRDYFFYQNWKKTYRYHRGNLMSFRMSKSKYYIYRTEFWQKVENMEDLENGTAAQQVRTLESEVRENEQRCTYIRNRHVCFTVKETDLCCWNVNCFFWCIPCFLVYQMNIIQCRYTKSSVCASVLIT
jgi:hypothetical protein